MTRHVFRTAAVFAGAVLMTNCAAERAPIDRVQPRFQHKSFFVGQDLVSASDNPVFYARGTLTDGVAGAGLDTAAGESVTRIAWEITEFYLNARLAPEVSGEGDLGEIVASFGISSHFDIQQEYNAATGELINVLSENSIDRPWYDRAYIRVDWSLNCNLVAQDPAVVTGDLLQGARVQAVSTSGSTLSDASVGAFVAYERDEGKSFLVGEELVALDEGGDGDMIAACASEKQIVDRVQPDHQAKSFFVGESLTSIEDDPEFFMRGTLVDVGYGANQDGLFTSTWAQPVTRVKWEITEDFLNARLAYERVDGTDGKGEPMSGTGFKTANDGLVVASYRIISHFDIKRGYNPATGELSNTLEENESDRPWNEREYLRVDWSANHSSDNYDFDLLSQIGIYGSVKYEPLSFPELDPNNENAPHFAVDGSYFDITQKAFATPAEVDLSHLGWGIDSFPACWLEADFFGGSWPGGQCGPVELTVRNSFRRVVDTDYEPINVDGYRFQAYGIFTEDRVGYEREYGMVDTKWFRFAARYNIWERSHYYDDAVTMTGPVECNTRESTELGLKWVETTPGVFTESVTNDPNADPNRDDNRDGTADECEAVTDTTGVGGSQCDTFKKRCTLPYRLRSVRTIPWHVTTLTDDPDLFDTSEWATEEWDLAVKASVQVARLVECKNTGGGTACATEYPMWGGQQDIIDIGIRLMRDLTYCRREAGDWNDASCTAAFNDRIDDLVAAGEVPTEMDALAAVTLATPVFVLCHNPVESSDHVACGTPGTKARIGDLRYHSINIVKNPQTPSPWGIMVNAVDPYWGEHIATSANIWDHVTTLASQGFADEIRYINGELTTQEITNGDYIRAWGAAQGLQRTPTMSRAQINSRLAAVVGMNIDAFEERASLPMPPEVRDRFRPLQHDMADTATLAGVPSQAKMMAAARMRAARGTTTEATLMNPAMMQISGVPGDLPIEGPLADMASPLALNHPQIISDIQRRLDNAMAAQGGCMIEQGPEPTSTVGLAKIMKEKFPVGVSETASERQDRWESMLRFLRRRLHYGVLAHEMGHAVGLRHNFVSSSDPLFYRPQYWQLRTKNGTVDTLCTDAVADGSTCIGPRYFDPVTDEEADQMINMFQQSTVMDYPGDVSQDMIGLGVYDFAATRFFYSDDVAVYKAVTHTAGSPIGVGIAQATDTFGGLFGIRFTLGDGTGSGDIPIHYSELADKYRVISGCYNVTPEPPTYWDEAADGEWHPVLDGHVVQIDGQYSKCRQLSVDYASWNNLRLPTDEELSGGYYRGGPAVDPQGRLRVPYGFATDRWADLGNASVYRHDNGADAFEITQFLIQKQENRHIFDNFRRGRTDFSVRRASQRAFGRYNEKLLGMAGGVGFYANIYKNYATSTGYSFDSWWPQLSTDFLRENTIAASMVFDHFARQLARPQTGAHYKYNPDPNESVVYEEKALRSEDDADGYVPAGATALVIPNGTSGYGQDVGVGGAPLENGLEDQGEFDTEYVAYAGSYYNKINTAILFSESEDRFVSQSRGDFYDARFRAAGMADVFFDGWRRVVGNALTGDRSLLGPRAATDAASNPLLDVTADTSTDPLADMYPAQPLGWVSWWPTVGPQLCFPSLGREVCRTTDDATAFDPDLPAYSRPVDPQIGWEVQKFLIAWTLAHIRENQNASVIDMLRIYRVGQNSDPWFTTARIEWQDPTSGQLYVARSYGRECLFGTGSTCVGGQMAEKGIAARVLEYANQLTAAGYELDTAGYPATGDRPAGFNEYRRAMYKSHPSGLPIVKVDPTVWEIDPGGATISPIDPCDQNVDPTCTALEVWSNRAAVNLQSYKSVPDYLWEVMKAYHLATPDQVGVYPW